MLSAKLVVTLLLSQYVRSQVDRTDPKSQCLWWQDGTVITVEQSAAGNPETPGETEFSAISAAFATWGQQLAACGGGLRFEEAPRTAGRTVAEDGHNVVLFRQVDCDALVPSCASPRSCGNERDCWEHANDALALTTTSYDATGRITDSDVEFNTPSFIFTTVDFPACVSPNFHVGCVASDVQNTMTHEAGHLLGLAHSPAFNSTMSTRAAPGELGKRALDADSKQFLCEVYRPGPGDKGCVLPAASNTLGKGGGCAILPGLELGLLGLFLLRRRAR